MTGIQVLPTFRVGGNVVACPPAAVVPLFIFLLGQCCAQVPAIVRRQHRNYILLDKEIEGTGNPRAVRCVGFYLVYNSDHHLPLNVYLNSVSSVIFS